MYYVYIPPVYTYKFISNLESAEKAMQPNPGGKRAGSIRECGTARYGPQT